MKFYRGTFEMPGEKTYVEWFGRQKEAVAALEELRNKRGAGEAWVDRMEFSATRRNVLTLLQREATPMRAERVWTYQAPGVEELVEV